MPDSELDEGIKQDYGRLNFRGVTMAYLILGDQKRFTLTDVVCNLYPLTPRTTVISRMDKMKIVRTPCTPEQIRKLKAARGVHSSSVVCSLVSKQAIEAFCDKYPIDVRVGPTVVTDKEENGKNFSKIINKLGKKNNAVPNSCKDKTVSAKKRRSKKNASDFSRERRANTAEMMNGEGSVLTCNADGPCFHSHTIASFKGSKTTSNENLFCKSFLASNYVTTQAKISKNRSFPSNQTTSKLSKGIKNGYLPTKRKKLLDSNEGNAPVRKLKKVKLKHSNSEERLVVNEHSLSVVNKLDSQCWLVDNFSDRSGTSLSSSPIKAETCFSSIDLNTHEDSATSAKKEQFSTPKKKTTNSKSGKPNKDIIRLNASPPSLILKRQGKRTWQVEQRTIHTPTNKILRLTPCLVDQGSNFSPPKKKDKKGSADAALTNTVKIKGKKNDTGHQTRKAAANICKSKSLTKNSDGSKGEIKKKRVKKRGPKCIGSNSVICANASEQITTCKRQKVKTLDLNLNQKGKVPLRKKRRKGMGNIKQETFLPNSEITTKIGNGKVSKLKKIKTEPLSEEEEEVDYKFSQQKNSSTNFHQFPTPESTPSATPTEVKPTKVVVKLTPVKTKLKANAKFNFMDIFPTEPSLTLKNGDLAPAYSLCSNHSYKTPLLSLSTWRIGGGVVGRKNVKYKVRSTK